MKKYHLIVAATEHEVQPLTKNAHRINDMYNLYNLWQNTCLLVGGVGQYSTIFHLMNCLQKTGTPQSIINIGICGSYTENHAPENIVQVENDVQGDQLVESPEDWSTWHKAGIVKERQSPLTPSTPPWADALRLPKVSGLTTDFLTGKMSTIQKRKTFFKADVETMEGAAVFYVAERFNIPALQIRAVSNYVEQREKKHWKLNESISQLNKFVLENLKPILTRY